MADSDQGFGGELGAVIPGLIDALAEAIVTKLRSASDDGWVAQEESRLGRNKHCAAVRRRVAAGDIRAAMANGRFLLTREALNEELRGPAVAKPLAKTEPASDGIEARILRKLEGR